jgi:excisionase family DNA binding protein
MKIDEQSSQGRLMTPQELADYVGVPVATTHVWRSKGVGPRAFKVGRHLRYRRADVDRWLESRGTPTAA